MYLLLLCSLLAVVTRVRASKAAEDEDSSNVIIIAVGATIIFLGLIIIVGVVAFLCASKRKSKEVKQHDERKKKIEKFRQMSVSVEKVETKESIQKQVSQLSDMQNETAGEQKSKMEPKSEKKEEASRSQPSQGQKSSSFSIPLVTSKPGETNAAGYPEYVPIGTFAKLEKELDANLHPGLNNRIRAIDKLVAGIDEMLITGGLKVDETTYKTIVPKSMKAMVKDFRNPEMVRMRVFYYEHLRAIKALKPREDDIAHFLSLNVWNLYLHWLRSDINHDIRRKLAVFIALKTELWFQKLSPEELEMAPHPLPMFLQIKQMCPRYFDDHVIQQSLNIDDPLEDESPDTVDLKKSSL